MNRQDEADASSRTPRPKVPPPLPAARGSPSPQQQPQRLIAAGLIASREIVLTAKACAGQARRLLGFGRSKLGVRQLEQRLQLAMEALGRRLEAAGLGDARIRQQLADLVERRHSMAAANGPTRLLDAEQRGLYIRLAEPFVVQPVSPAGVEAEHRQATALCSDLAAVKDAQSIQRQELLPSDSGTRLRVIGGFGTVALLFFLLLWMMSSGDGVRDEVATAPDDGSPAVLPGLAPGEGHRDASQDDGSAAPVQKEAWVNEDAYFPRRRVVANYVNDQPHGECRCFDAQDRLIAIENYRQGALHGKRTSYYPSGRTFCELRFENGVAEGTSTTWFENGTVADTIEFVHGVLHGKSTAWFENGNKFLESHNVQGVAHGERLHYLPDGRCFGTSNWENGRQTGQQIQIDVDQVQYQAIQARSEFSLLLKDHWR